MSAGTKGLSGAKLEETLKKNFEESRFDPYKKRFGLFSYPGTLAISEDSLGRHKLPLRDTDGKVLTAPKNLYTSNGKKGHINDAYFSPPQFATVGEPFKDNFAINHSLNKERAQRMAATHEVAFRPGGARKEAVALYPHESDFVDSRKNYRDSETREVKTGPKNFMTSPAKKGEANTTPGVLIGGYPQHGIDPYERKAQMHREERIKHNAKLQPQAFKGMSHGDREFANVPKTYGLDVEIPPKKTRAATVGFHHDKPFAPSNPAKKGVTDKTLAPFPEYMSRQLRDKVRAQTMSEHYWRHTYNERTKPSPSVATLPRNLHQVTMRSIK
jgi:hypothetical protein